MEKGSFVMLYPLDGRKIIKLFGQLYKAAKFPLVTDVVSVSFDENEIGYRVNGVPVYSFKGHLRINAGSLNELDEIRTGLETLGGIRIT